MNLEDENNGIIKWLGKRQTKGKLTAEVESLVRPGITITMGVLSALQIVSFMLMVTPITVWNRWKIRPEE